MVGIISDEKSGILYRKWGESRAKSVFILVHGLGAQGARWVFFAEYFARNGAASYALELKGFGETHGPKGHINSFETYYRDILTLRRIAEEEHPGGKIFIAGESMGGLMAFVLAAREPVFDGLICISPVFKSKLKFSAIDYIGIFLAALFRPKKRFFVHFDSTMCTRDTEYLKVMDSNPHEHRSATASLLRSVLFAQIEAMFAVKRLKVPTLFLVAGDDLMVDAASTEKEFKNIRVKEKLLIKYPEMYHALTVDLGREKVFADVMEWTEKRMKA